MKKRYFLLLIAVVILFAGCADVSQIDECVKPSTYGFWAGLWHGLIACFSFIGSLFSDEIAMYALNNDGALYDLGFVLGSGILGGGLSQLIF